MISSLTKSTLQSLGVALSFSLFFLTVPEPAPGQEIDQTVARISYVSGAVSYSRGDDPDDWDAALINVPFALGDRIYSPRDGRAELQLPGGNFVRLAPRTYFTALNLTYDVKQFYLGEGTASFNIKHLASDEIFEVDTPNIAVTLEARGRYRVEVDEEGNSRVVVRRGRAFVAANGRQVTVEEGEIRVYGIDSPQYEFVALRGPDPFDRWVNERDERFERAYRGASEYASDQVIGVEDLREYGRWEQIPEYGYAWTPARVPAGWQPYTVGHWFWQDPWGWTWISEEPWGWAPFHYGRWTFHRSRWYWVPVGRRVQVVRYAPALVGFVRVKEHVGWFPLHPRDRFIPWWGPRVERQNITFVNRTHVTIVNQNTFVSAGRVTTNIVRESVVVREATSVRVTGHLLPVPRRSSLRVAIVSEVRRSERPPAHVLSRPAVVRHAPPPPPPTFREKLPEIEKSQGAPITPDAALAMGLRNVKASDRRHPIRPAAVGGSRADFAPRTAGGSAPPPQPLSAARGKKLATAEEPFLTNLPQRAERPERSPRQPEQADPASSEPSKGAAKTPEPQEGQQKQEQERQKQEKRLQEQQPKEQQQARKEQQRQDLKRQQKQEREHLKQEGQSQGEQPKEQQRKGQQQLRKDQRREGQERPEEKQRKKEEEQ